MKQMTDIIHLQLVIPQILRSFEAATKRNSTWYKAWHSWALCNFEVISYYEKQEKKRVKGSWIGHSHSSSSSSPSSSASSSSSRKGPGSAASVRERLEERVKAYIVPAVNAFFRSIALAPSEKSLQDTLRLLTLWFKYAHIKAVETALVKGFNTVSIDTWLQVIPQVMQTKRTQIKFLNVHLINSIK
jgi:FKBP12-rapamycin complex-associated protein